MKFSDPSKQPLPIRLDSLGEDNKVVRDISCGFGNHMFAFVTIPSKYDA